MNNNVNGNLNNNTSVQVNPGIANVNNGAAVQVNPNVANVNNGAITSNTVAVNTPQTASNVQNKKQKMDSNYVMIIVFVVFVLIIAVVLLVLLLGGNILNRNRLSCSKVTSENGYTLTIDRIYKFDGTTFTRVYDTHTHKYSSNLTDEMYNQNYVDVINAENGVTGYGFNTTISKAADTVTINAYTINMHAGDKDAARQLATADGFLCD